MMNKNMISRRMKRALFAMLAMLLFGNTGFFIEKAAAEEDPHAKHRAMMQKKSAVKAETASVNPQNKRLLNQDGEPVRFVDDVLGERIVVVDFIYTTCTTVCPVLSAILGQVQQQLAGELGPELHLVSVSVDPVRDTPERLKAYAANHRAGPEWVWLTGDKTEVDEVLRGLGAYTPDFEDHPSMILVGDASTGTWKRFFGFPGPDKIVAAIEELQAARQLASTR